MTAVMTLFLLCLLNAHAQDPTAWDLDNDGLAGPDDHCPEQREDINSWQDDDGCPDMDADRDGLYDFVDASPWSPDPPDVALEAPYLLIRFPADGAVILGDQHRALAGMARWLELHPEVRLLVVHGTSTPDEAGGEPLARARANAVREGLRLAGVAWDRLLIGPCKVLFVEPGEPSAALRMVAFSTVIFAEQPPAQRDPWGLARPDDPWGSASQTD